MIEYIIRKAKLEDVDSIDAIMRQFPKELGWVQKTKIIKAITSTYCHVAEEKSTHKIVGAVVFNIPTKGKNRGYSVIYDLAVDRNHQRKQIAKHLVLSVPCPIRLLVKNDNEAAIRFYHKMNFVRAEKKKSLSLFELHIHFMFIMGGNKKRETLISGLGVGFGSRNTDWNMRKPHDVAILDFNWKHPEKWDSYIQLIARYSPIYAVVMDYESTEQKEEMLSKIDEVKALGVLYPIIVLKNELLIKDIPQDSILGMSVPTKYSGYLPKNWSILRDRTLHILGGSPTNINKNILNNLKKHDIHVNSWDSNTHEVTAKYGKLNISYNVKSFYLKDLFRKKGGYYILTILSTNNISKLSQYMFRFNRNKHENFIGNTNE